MVPKSPRNSQLIAYFVFVPRVFVQLFDCIFQRLSPNLVNKFSKMVHLTQSLMKMMARWYPTGITSYTSDRRYFKKMRWLKLLSSYNYRHRNCIKLGRRRWERTLQISHENKKEKSITMRDLYSQRIWAALNEHRFPYKYFLGVLPSVGIELDRKVIASLAIFEPRSFASLIEICKAKVASDPRGEEATNLKDKW